jgi:hypothetical protein
MFEHFWPKIDGFWQHSDRATDAAHPVQTAQPDHDNEFRCYSCGEYIDIYVEICPYCGHSPDPSIEDFTKTEV